MGLLTWEKQKWDDDEKEYAREIAKDLAAYGIKWQRLPMRQMPIPLIPKATTNIIFNALKAFLILKSGNYNFVHCRSYLPAFLMLFLKWIIQIPFIFDMRGFLPEEYVLAQHWEKGSWKFRLAKNLEWKCLKSSAAVITTNSGMRENLFSQLSDDSKDQKLIENKVVVIENCTDIDLFRPSKIERLETRNEFGLTDEIVIAWVCGGIATWHLPEQTIDFFQKLKKRISTAKFMVLTKSMYISQLFERKGFSLGDVIIKSVEHKMVPRYLNAADAGIVLVSPETATFPVKVAEYLACGLPVILDKGVDRNIPLTCKGVGVLIEEYDSVSYDKAIENLLKVLGKGEEIKRACRRIAEEKYSLPAAVEKYEMIYRNICGKK